MSLTLGVVEVPNDRESPAGPAPSAFLARRFGDKPLLTWITRRLTEPLLLEQVVVIAEPHQQEALLPLIPADVALYCGTHGDSLARLAAAVRHFEATRIVRISGLCPLVDPELLDRLIGDANAHPGCDYLTYTMSNGQSALRSGLGFFAEWIHCQALLQADRECQGARHREDLSGYFLSHPEQFHLRFIPVPEKLDREDIRLTVDVEEDWEHAQTILEALGPDRLEWRRIAELLSHQPGLRRRMAELNQAGTAAT